METRTAAVRTLLFLLITLALYLFLWQTLSLFFDLPLYYYARLVEILTLFLFAALALFTPLSFENMGIAVSARTLRKSLAAGAAVGGAFVAAVAIFRTVTGDISFSWRVAGDVSRATYIVVAPFQEIMTKSVMLCSFETVFEGRRPRLANVMAALCFGAFHIVYGIRVMLAAVALGLVTGRMFRKNRCVWGCALAHFICGFFPACFGI